MSDLPIADPLNLPLVDPNLDIGLTPVGWPGTENAEINKRLLGAWDSMKIGTHAVPGIVTVRGSMVRHIQEKRSPAKDGGNPTLLNYEAQFDVRVRMWTSEHFDEWFALTEAIRPSANSKSKRAWGVSHPALNTQGISKAVVISVSVPERGVGREVDVWQATIKLREWRKPVAGSKPKTPTASKPVAVTTDLQKAADAAAPSTTNTGP